MSFLKSIFGRSAPTTETASAALARVEADLAAAPARIAAAEAALQNVADMSDADHAAAIAERDAAGRSITRLEAQVAQLQGALADAEKAEEADALAARAKAAGAKLAAYSGLLDRHDVQASALAATLAEMEDVEREIVAVNREIDAARNAGLKAPTKVETPDARYRAEPDVVTPETRVFEEKVVFRQTTISYGPQGEERPSFCDIPVSATRRSEGKLVLGPGERIAMVERVTPASTKVGRRCCSPTSETVLAPARIGQAALWPRAS